MVDDLSLDLLRLQSASISYDSQWPNNSYRKHRAAEGPTMQCKIACTQSPLNGAELGNLPATTGSLNLGPVFA
jgi:hypothetical protein